MTIMQEVRRYLSWIGAATSTTLLTLLLLGIALLVVPPTLAAENSVEIDATIWQVVSTTVEEQDIEGMAAVYHPDAVLVSSRGTTAIADALAGWGDGMERQREEGRSASVSFRFSSRQDAAETAFESGVFRYAETDEDGVEQSVFVPFEALLVKKDGRWLLVMERQFEPTDESAWNSLAPAASAASDPNGP